MTPSRPWASATATGTSSRRPSRAGTPTSCGRRRASSATSASTCPIEYGGGGGGITELAIVCEELAAAGCPLLLLVVSPAIAGRSWPQHGTAEQRQRFLPGIADGTLKVVFAITEPEAGSNFHRLGTTARRDGDEWVLNGRKCFISGVDEAPYVLVVARTEDAATGKLKPALFLVPTDAPGLTQSKLDMEIVSPENQFLLYLDDVRVPADALVGGDTDAGLPALFAGLNPERITVAAMGVGIGPLRAGARLVVRRHPLGLGPPDRQPPGRRPPAGPRARSRSSWPG